MAITIRELTSTKTFSELIDDINANFDAIYQMGGGPKGEIGPRGPIGVPGPRGLRGNQWYASGSTPTPYEGIFLEGDSWLSAGGTVFVYGSTNFLSTSVNLKGPTGSTGATGGSEDLLFIQLENVTYNQWGVTGNAGGTFSGSGFDFSKLKNTNKSVFIFGGSDAFFNNSNWLRNFGWSVNGTTGPTAPLYTDSSFLPRLGVVSIVKENTNNSKLNPLTNSFAKNGLFFGLDPLGENANNTNISYANQFVYTGFEKSSPSATNLPYLRWRLWSDKTEISLSSIRNSVSLTGEKIELSNWNGQTSFIFQNNSIESVTTELKLKSFNKTEIFSLGSLPIYLGRTGPNTLTGGDDVAIRNSGKDYGVISGFSNNGYDTLFLSAYGTNPSNIGSGKNNIVISNYGFGSGYNNGNSFDRASTFPFHVKVVLDSGATSANVWGRNATSNLRWYSGFDSNWFSNSNNNSKYKSVGIGFGVLGQTETSFDNGSTDYSLGFPVLQTYYPHDQTIQMDLVGAKLTPNKNPHLYIQPGYSTGGTTYGNVGIGLNPYEGTVSGHWGEFGHAFSKLSVGGDVTIGSSAYHKESVGRKPYGLIVEGPIMRGYTSSNFTLANWEVGFILKNKFVLGSTSNNVLTSNNNDLNNLRSIIDVSIEKSILTKMGNIILGGNSVNTNSPSLTNWFTNVGIDFNDKGMKFYVNKRGVEPAPIFLSNVVEDKSKFAGEFTNIVPDRTNLSNLNRLIYSDYTQISSTEQYPILKTINILETPLNVTLDNLKVCYNIYKPSPVSYGFSTYNTTFLIPVTNKTVCLDLGAPLTFNNLKIPSLGTNLYKDENNTYIFDTENPAEFETCTNTPAYPVVKRYLFELFDFGLSDTFISGKTESTTYRVQPSIINSSQLTQNQDYTLFHPITLSIEDGLYDGQEIEIIFLGGSQLDGYNKQKTHYAHQRFNTPVKDFNKNNAIHKYDFCFNPLPISNITGILVNNNWQSVLSKSFTNKNFPRILFNTTDVSGIDVLRDTNGTEKIKPYYYSYNGYFKITTYSSIRFKWFFVESNTSTKYFDRWNDGILNEPSETETNQRSRGFWIEIGRSENNNLITR